MRKLLQIALGIIAAVGGFVDIGELVFNAQAGAEFGYGLLWAVPVGVVGIATYAEMCGRVAAVARRPVFDVVRMRLGFGVGLVTLISSQLLNLLTLAAEVGGVALVLQLLFDVDLSLVVLATALGLLAVIWFLPFPALERIFGYGGLLLLVFVAAAWHLDPDWHDLAAGFQPRWEWSSLYAYFVVGVVAAALVPYEVHFYSSGGVEEGWTPEEDLGVNRMNAILGFGLGGVLSVAIIAASAQVLNGIDVQPEFLGTTALVAERSFGETGLLLALGGMLFAVGGAAIEVSLSGAYNLAQFAGWEWGKYRTPTGAPRFTLTWAIFIVLAFVVIVTGVDPVVLTEYAVVLSVVALPFTYLPIVLIARDRTYMGDHANGPVSAFLGWLYLVVIVVLAIVAIPLLVATNGGGG